MAFPSGMTALHGAFADIVRIPMWSLTLLFLTHLSQAVEQTADTFYPLGPERVLVYRLQGTAVLDDGTIYGLSGSSSVTFALPVVVAERELVPVTSVTALEWEGISVMAADTMFRYMWYAEEGVMSEGTADAVPSLTLPSALSPGLSWLRVREGSTDTMSVVSSGRTIAIPAGRFPDCVGILANRGKGVTSSRSLEFLAPGVGRVMMVEELSSPGGWRLQLIHVLEEVRPNRGSPDCGSPSG